MLSTKSLSWMNVLDDLNACHDARLWADKQSSPETAWQSCERADWMLWIAAKLKVDRKIVVAAACDCAERALKYVPDGEDRPRKAIETARAWIKGDATLDEVRDAAAAYAAADAAADAAAYAAAYAYAAADAAAYAAADAAAYAAAAAAYVAYVAADAAAYAAAAAAYVAYVAADAAAYAAAAAVRTKELKEMAAIVRQVITWETIVERLKIKLGD